MNLDSPLGLTSRRWVLRAAFATAAATLVARDGSAQQASPAASGFPLEIPGEFGATVIPAQPERLVTLGWSDVDVALALGVVPVGIYQFFPAMERGVGAWAEDLLGDAEPHLFPSGEDIDLEALVGLQPDLISAIERIDSDEAYQQLANIAPTLGLPVGAAPNGIPWQVMTQTVSAGLGMEAEGQELIAQTEELLATAASSHPEFAGKTFSVLLAYNDQLGFWTTADTRTQLISALGLDPSQFVQDAGTEVFFADVSLEKVVNLDADVVIFLSYLASTIDELKEQFPTITNIPAVADGRAIAIDTMELNLGMSISSVLSIPFSIEQLGQRLNEVIPPA